MSVLRFLSVLSVLLCFAFPVQAREGRPKNVLFIVSDDLNNRLGCYGDSMVQTPNLDRLASRGTVFEKAYCAYPLCGPSRNSFLTGLYPNSTGIFLNGQIFRQSLPQQISMPQLFRQNGYLSVRIGKMYHYNVPNSIGTDGHDDPASWEIQMNPAGVDRTMEEPDIFSLVPGQFGGTLSWYASPREDRLHTDGLNAADANWVLERCAKDRSRPFFLALGFFRPHTPYVSPRSYFEKYPADKMPLVKGVEEDRKDIPVAALGSHKKEQDTLNDDLRAKAVQAYSASISFMDAQLGQVVATLDRLGLADDTVICFTSDHGYHLGEHGLWQKMSLFEESARVPLLVVAPGMGKGTRVKAPVSHVDMLPTLAELCGIPAPKSAQGQSLVPMLRDASAQGRGWALTQVMRGAGGGRADVGTQGKRFFGYSLRTDRWRYTEWDEGRKGRELYDHQDDAKELTNLADKPEHAATVALLAAQLREAVVTTLPPGGQSPEVREGPLWAPRFME
jgi:iduronate 2-sulfatase